MLAMEKKVAKILKKIVRELCFSNLIERGSFIFLKYFNFSPDTRAQKWNVLSLLRIYEIVIEGNLKILVLGLLYQ